MLGGDNGTFQDTVWSSADGITWEEQIKSATGKRFSARNSHSSLAFANSADGKEKMWVLGGNDGARKNDVWSSEDGKDWILVNIYATEKDKFSAREGHSSLVFKDPNDNDKEKMWVLGGSDSVSTRKNDVYASADGVTWNLVTAAAKWEARTYHTSLVFDNKMWVLGGQSLAGSDLNDVWWSTDGKDWHQEITQTPTWPARWGHSSLAFTDPADNLSKMWVLGGRAGPNDRNDVWWSTNGQTWKQDRLADWSPRFGHSGVTFKKTMWVIGGDKSDVWYYDPPAVAPARPKPITITAGWKQAASAAAFGNIQYHTSLAFAPSGQTNKRLWVIGGLTAVIQNNISTAIRQNKVWSSADGITWEEQIKSATGKRFSARNSHSSLAFANSADGKEKMWVLGGNDGARKNDVWSSEDGKDWKEEIRTAAWSVRSGHASLVFAGKMWVIGGDDGSNYKNDVYSSIDGLTWRRVGPNTNYKSFSARSYHSAFVFKNKMWVASGSDSIGFKSDMWSSGDGINWEQESTANWLRRQGHTSLVFTDTDDNLEKMWIMGGRGNRIEKNDIWWSTNGQNWTQHRLADWSPREAHSSVLFKGKMWVIGGSQTGDVWYYPDSQTIVPTGR